tara:strand:- start:220 stop:444 length:225 start_codon:yes stop_codon:yes gene_type:complete
VRVLVRLALLAALALLLMSGCASLNHLAQRCIGNETRTVYVERRENGTVYLIKGTPAPFTGIMMSVGQARQCEE